MINNFVDWKLSFLAQTGGDNRDGNKADIRFFFSLGNSCIGINKYFRDKNCLVNWQDSVENALLITGSSSCYIHDFTTAQVRGTY